MKKRLPSTVAEVEKENEEDSLNSEEENDDIDELFGISKEKSKTKKSMQFSLSFGEGEEKKN